MYAVGGPHPLKQPCARILLLLAERPDAFVTDAEVLQELVHRYLALRRWHEGRDVFQRFADGLSRSLRPTRNRPPFLPIATPS